MSVAKPYKAGWVKDSFTSVRKTDGQLRYIPGAARGMIARITIHNDKAPEIPNLEVVIHAGWAYLSTDYVQGNERVIYEFELDDEDADKLQSIVWFFDTLYG